MTVEAKDLALRARRLVESMSGIRHCRVDAAEGEIEFIEATVEPGRSAERTVREIRGALLAYLGRAVSADRIRIEISEEAEAREPESEGAPSEAGPPEHAQPAASSSGPSDWARPETRSPAGGTPHRPTDRVRGSSGSATGIRLAEYKIVGGRGHGVDVQVSVTDDTGRTFEGRASAESLAAVRSETFIDAAVQAARSMMEERDRYRGGPARDLEVSSREEGVKVGEDRFLAVTLEVRDAAGRVRATGFEVMGGKVGADVAIGATLDALGRLVRGEGVRVSDAGGG